MVALTPSDLGERGQLLIDKHAAYIQSFFTNWEVRLECPSSRRHTSSTCHTPTHQHHPPAHRTPAAWSMSPRSTFG